MTTLQPTKAPWVHIQALPKNYLLATGEHYSSSSTKYERLTVYMPNAFGYCTAGDDRDDDDIEEEFMRDHCRNCDYYFDTGEGNANGLSDNDGHPIVACTVGSKCPCYDNGLGEVDWPCEEGYDEPNWGGRQEEFPMPPMAFAIDLYQSRLVTGPTSAWVQKLHQDLDGSWYTGQRLRAINAYDSELVCWGNDNSTPASLPEAVTTYCDAPANNDLLSIDSFINNCSSARRDTYWGAAVSAAQVSAGYDALLLATATATPDAYLLLRASGFPAKDGLIVAGLTKASHTLDDGQTVPAYLTDPIICGRSWLLIDNPDALEEGGEAFDNQGLLLGQIETSTTQPPCDFPAPSSSAPAALAAC